MTTAKEHNDELVRKLTERNKIADFAMQTLGCDERRADVFVKACGDFFVWDGTLRFKGASGEVAADDAQCTGFFQREFDFLLPATAAGDHQAALDPDLIAKAKAGNLTARGQLFRDLHGDKPRTQEGETAAALEKLLAGEQTSKPADKKLPANNFSGSNPWAAASWNLTEQGRLVKALGEVKAAGIAKAAGSFIGATKPARAA